MTTATAAPGVGRLRQQVEESGYRALVLHRLVREAALLVASRQACLLVNRDEDGAAIFAAGFRIDEELIGRTLAATETCPPTVDLSAGPFSGDPSAPGRAAWAPVRSTAGELRGWLEVAEAAQHLHTERYVGLLSRQAQQIGAALDHARMPRSLSGEILDETERLAGDMDARVGYALPKAAEVELVREIAGLLDLSIPATIEAELAALLYDVGLVGAGAGELEHEELMRLEPEWSAQTLVHVPGLEAVATVVRHHRERWDGRGEPSALQGLCIPIGSRVVGVCRAFRELTSPSGTSRALALEAALEQLQADSGTRYDPNVVAAAIGALSRR